MPLLGHLKTGAMSTVSTLADAANTALVTIDITWTSNPPTPGKLVCAAGQQSPTYRRKAPAAQETMTLRIRVRAGNKAVVEVTSDGRTVTQREAKGGNHVWTYTTK